MADMEVSRTCRGDRQYRETEEPADTSQDVESLSRYIQKHDEYSNWEARVWMLGAGERVNCLPRCSGRRPNAGAG